MRVGLDNTHPPGRQPSMQMVEQLVIAGEP
jgi:hypothetical protein